MSGYPPTGRRSYLFEPQTQTEAGVKMARIAGVDIPREKRAVVSLTYIYGIGRTLASHVCEASESMRKPESKI